MPRDKYVVGGGIEVMIQLRLMVRVNFKFQ